MKTIHIYFTSGSELMVSVTEEQRNTILDDLEFENLIGLPHDEKHILIPLTAIERIEIEK